MVKNEEEWGFWRNIVDESVTSGTLIAFGAGLSSGHSDEHRTERKDNSGKHVVGCMVR